MRGMVQSLRNGPRVFKVVQTLLRDALAEAIVETLAVIRGASSGPFEDIRTVALDWLSESRLSRKSVSSSFDLTPEQLRVVADFRPDAPSRLHNRTWAKAAVGLLLGHPDLQDQFGSLTVHEVQAQPEDAAKRALAAIGHLAARSSSDAGGHSQIADRLQGLAYESRLPRAYRDGTLTRQRFSEGLREALLRFNAELQYLTVEQVRALEASLVHRRLWIEGPAGSGKTIFAVEAAYRKLRSGASCVIAFRTTQFSHVFRRLLEDSPGMFHLLSHADLMRLLWALEIDGRNSPRFRKLAEDLLPGLEVDGSGPLIDLIVVDDCAVDSLSPRLDQLDALAFRTILLAAPDQALDLLFSENEDETGVTGVAPVETVIPHEWDQQTCPAGYHPELLTRNLRNARAIAKVCQSFTRAASHPAVREAGAARVVRTRWDQLESEIMAQTAILVESFPPGRIHVLVDPYLQVPSSPASPIVRAVAHSATRNFWFEALEQGAEDALRDLLGREGPNRLKYVHVRGNEASLVTTVDLPDTAVRNALDEAFQAWESPDVDAGRLLDPQALADPFATANAIAIYPSPLFIGLESDAVIYVRNEDDPVVATVQEDSVRAQVEEVRRHQHLIALSRAKYCLVDLRVS